MMIGRLVALLALGAVTQRMAVFGAEAEEVGGEEVGPQRYKLQARASGLDPKCRAHPEIDFLLEDEDGQPGDVQQASVDTRVAPRGELVIWLMSANDQLFEELNGMGLHVIQPHYARHWFSLCCRDSPVGEECRGNIRLEAATGEDFSEEVTISKPDGMMERSHQLVRWLARENPEGHWEQFLAADGSGLRWEKVIVAGISHGSTTAARFAKHVKVSRVVAFSGPRDQYQSWQALPSVTPRNRYFGFTHVLDGGWIGDHYCRSWELLGMGEFGPIVNVEQMDAPYGNTRRLVTDVDVGGDSKRAHGAVVPGRGALRDAEGGFGHREVWRYLFTHPVELVGEAVPSDGSCVLDQRAALKSVK